MPFPYPIGTRNSPTQSRNTALPPSGSVAQSLSADVGMSKRVVASITFVNSSTKQLQAANGTFAAFSVGDEIMIEGTNLNNGLQQVAAIDGTNHSFLTVALGLKNEGPISATVRAV